MATAQFPVKVGDAQKQVSCFWAKRPGHAETGALKAWVGNNTPRQRDAVELARLAALKWEITCDVGTVASSLIELEAVVRVDARADVTGMLLVEARWFESGPLGVCLFHRTWAGNLFLDFLAAHPEAERSDARISGVGIGLLYHVCEAAHRLQAGLLWDETMALSASQYRGYFQLPGESDQLAVTPAQQDIFRRSVRDRWARAAQS